MRIRGALKKLKMQVQVSGPVGEIQLLMTDNCEVRNSQEMGVGLYAKKDFKKGETVLVCQIEEAFCANSVHASQVGPNQWHKFTLLGRSINHSCDPNVGIGFDGKNWLYVAFKNIKSGDELFYDYAMANQIVENMGQCVCGAKNCRKDIKGFSNLPVQRKKDYTGFYAPYLEEKNKILS